MANFKFFDYYTVFAYAFDSSRLDNLAYKQLESHQPKTDVKDVVCVKIFLTSEKYIADEIENVWVNNIDI